MATQTEPTTSAIFRAMRHLEVDPELAYEVAEENRRQAGENVIAAIGAEIAQLRAEMETRFASVDARFASMETRLASMDASMETRLASMDASMETRLASMDALMKTRFASMDAHLAEIKASIATQTSRIDVLQRVIWPLVISLLAVMMGLLYKAVFN